MSVIRELSASPYFDDFSPETKDFLRVLFRPGRAVQARELNQLQSILQMQIERLGNHIFKDGSIIYGGGTTIDTVSARYLKTEDLIPNTSEAFNPIVLIGKYIKGETSGAIGYVTTGEEKTSTDPPTIIFKEVNGIPFQGGENLIVVVQDSSGGFIDDLQFQSYNYTIAKTLSTNFYGKASTVSISNSIFYTKGIFVIAQEQTAPLDKYSDTPNKKAGLISTIQIVTENDDTTLLDNATGTYNYAAPGASRLKINLKLTSKDLTYIPSTTEDFIEILETRDGKLYKQISRPTYNELMKTLARRTFNESGNYTVRPFILNLENHPTDSDKLRAYLSPGLAYVNGFEFETIATQYVDIPKARDLATQNNQGTSIYYDNYFIVNKTIERPNIGINIGDFLYKEFDIFDSSSTNIGSCYVRSYEYNDANTYKLYVFGLTLSANKTISDINRFTSTTDNITFTINGTPKLYNPTNNVLIFDTGYERINDITDISLIYKKIFTVNNANTVTLSVSGNETFFDTNANSYIVYDSSGNNLPVTSVNIIGSTQVTLTYSGTAYKIIADVRSTLGTPNVKNPVIVKTSYGFIKAPSTTNIVKIEDYEPNQNNYYASCKIKIVGGTGAGQIRAISSYNEITKELTLDSSITVDETSYYQIAPYFTTSSDINIGYHVITSAPTNWELKIDNVYDGIKLVKVLKDASTIDDWFDTSKDITYMFEFNNGQTPEYYGLCTIKLKPEFLSSIGSFTNIHFFFNYFKHTINDGFFCHTSYPASDEIFLFTDADGKRINLKNSFDFRPTITNSAGAVLPTKSPKPYSFVSSDIEYYLAKIVKIIATQDETFSVIEGISAKNPIPPPDVDYGMTLYVIYLSPYTATKDFTKVKFIENKRYTMRDIGKIEKRVENLEYYTSLSLVESATAAMEVRDADGLVRSKNGILVDDFGGHNIGDVISPDYSCSIDILNKELRPPFKQKAFSLYPNTTSNFVVHSNGIGTRSYNLTSYISQKKASRTVNVNPYSVFLWKGTVELTPSSDIWKDTKTRPTNINNQNSLNNNILSGNMPWSSNFNDWNLDWAGFPEQRRVVSESVESRFVNTGETRLGNWEPDTSAPGNFNLLFRSFFGPPRISWVDPITNQQLREPVFVYWKKLPNGEEVIDAIVPAVRQEIPVFRTETLTTITEEFSRPTIKIQNQSLGDVVVSVQNIPFIRPRSVRFEAKGLKPNTKVYPFFDETSILQWVVFDSGFNGGITNSSGQISGVFNIPSNKFLTGERVFRLTDSQTNNKDQETTYCETKYYAQGLEEEKTTLTANIPTIGLSTRTETRTISRQSPPVIDPVAQSFFVDPVIFPNGIFIKEVDVYFAKKDTNIPIIMQIRENVNGYPSNIDILGETILQASSVLISPNASSSTTFQFTSPIYLKPGEYSIVLISNSNNYEVWTAKVGEKDVSSNTLISDQPYIGSLFMSQNSSTWTAEQTQDLKFEIRRCLFNTSSFNITLSDFNFTTLYPDIFTEVPVLAAVTNDTNVKIGNIFERNVVMGSLVSIKDSSSYSGTITNINYVTNTITLSSPISVTTDNILVIRRKAEFENVPLDGSQNAYLNGMDLIRPSISVFNPFNNIKLKYEIQTKNWNNTTFGPVTTISSSDNYEFSIRQRIEPSDESVRLSITGTAGTADSDVSPVFNCLRNYYVAVENLINNPDPVGEDNTPFSGNALVRYITKRSQLEDPASLLKVFLDIYRPQGTNIEVYYRTLKESDSTNISNINWKKMKSVQNIDNVYSNNASDYFETQFLPFDSGSGNLLSNIDPFIEFQVKIVLLSDNTTIIPKVKRLRVLALD